MNKASLVAYIANKTGLTKKDVTSSLDAMVEAVVKTVASGDSLTLTNFGTFVSVQRKKSEKRNPKTGAKVMVPAKRVPRFRVGKAFKEAVAKK
jgi:DNA-binding protein HU-beta